MRNLVPVSAVAAAVISASLLSAPAANAMVGSSAAPLQAAIDHNALTQSVAYGCRWRHCWGRGGAYRAYGFHPGWRRHWWGWHHRWRRW
jgi:hypothetical protein